MFAPPFSGIEALAQVAKASATRKWNEQALAIQDIVLSTGTRIRTQIEGFGDLYSTVELCPYAPTFPKRELRERTS